MPPKGKGAGKGKGGGKEGKGKWKTVEKKEKEEQEESSDAGADGWRGSPAMTEVCKGTAMRLSDLDAKATQLMDALEEAGKSEAACKFLSKSLEGVTRDKVSNWRAYIFTLLRGFDKGVYEAMKDKRGRPRPRLKDEKLTATLQAMTPLKATAPEFVPGQAWGGAPKEDGAKEEKAVTFKVTCTTASGESVGIIGSVEALGSWKDSAVVSMTVGSDSEWSSPPLKLGGGEVEYKFVVLGEDKAIVRREDGNRKLAAGEEPKAAAFGEV